MTQKNKKEKGKRDCEHRTGKITNIIKLEYIAEVVCWCGNVITIDSSKSLEENICQTCGSPYKLLNEEWTESEMKKFMELKGIK